MIPKLPDSEYENREKTPCLSRKSSIASSSHSASSEPSQKNSIDCDYNGGCMYCSSFPTSRKCARYIALTGYYYHLVKEDTWLQTTKNQHLSAVSTPVQPSGGLNQTNQIHVAHLNSMNGMVP